MKKIILFLFGLVLMQNGFAQKQTRAQNSRSDSLDITKTELHITNINKVAKTLDANAILHISSKINGVQNLILDLQGFTIDSIFINNTIALYSYTSPFINITLPTVLNTNDSTVAHIFYHGVPPADSLWGGFVFNGVYAFNMGVGFYSQPHVVGRMLFPCFDNFVERCPYEFFITTANTDMAVCNGILIDSVTNANNEKIWHWNLAESIPSYLVGVAVAPYTFVSKNLVGIATNKEALIACLPSDTNKVNGSFANLQKSFAMLEEHFGAYKWPRVGYSLVPFSAGAMEHASNIHIGLGFIDGTLGYETLIAHELSHHWFGDLATCSTAQDMWLNEGFASYCEMLHTEYVYGAAAYNKAYKDNHYKMLATAHINDDGYRAISNMDTNYTYSTTVYNKGADMIHTMRNYLGDSLFFASVKKYLSQHEFASTSTSIFNQSMNANTGVNMNDYFNDWIKQAGYANFCIDSTQLKQVGTDWEIKIFVRQRKHKNLNYYNNVMLPISIFKKDFSHQTIRTNFDQQCKVYTFTLPYEPAFVCIDEDEMISDASTANTQVFKTTGWKNNFVESKGRVRIVSFTNTADSILLRIEHHWVAPDRFKIPFNNYVLSDARYWQVNGVNLENIKGYLQFSYNGSTSNSYLDSAWCNASEAGIRLFYRKDATQDWTFANDSIVPGNLFDKNGSGYVREIKAGEYAFGINRPGYTDPIVTDAPIGPCTNIATNFSNNVKPTSNEIFELYPNPNSGKFRVQAKQLQAKKIDIVITNTEGKMIFVQELNAYQLGTEFDLQLPTGRYFISYTQQNILLQTDSILIQ
jgi:Peptidase family M1 domain/Secretion system C-terminal sorting domain/Peptidase M1 N-terminal domain